MRLYDPTPVLSSLKDFQKNTADYVFKRLYEDANGTTRFLVADEVGLGKTLVARGVIARAVRHLQEKKVKRIDIIYICSNADIAAQNIRRLTLPGFASFTRATRLTLLPLELRDLGRNRLNFVAFTPGTSFNLRSSMGTARERALLHVLLAKLWGLKVVTTSGGYRALQGWIVKLDSFKWHIAQVRGVHLDPDLVHQFSDAMVRADEKSRKRGEPGFQERFVDLAERLRYQRQHRPDEDWNDRTTFVGDLRQVLARTCIDALEPDFVILDEFQRFRNLLDGTDPASELAQEVFGYKDVRTLLLSATPYKMYSLNDEYADDHYQDFIRTARFLMNGQADRFAEDLDDFRRALFDLSSGDGRERAFAAKGRIERRLRTVMARTERLGLTADRSGMLSERTAPEVRLETQDLTAYLATQRIAEELDAGSVTEYWKSAPYLLNFMDGYKLSRQFEKIDRRTAAWKEIGPILESGIGLVPWKDVIRYEQLDPQNARLRSLVASTIEQGAWQLLWMPASMPYYTPGAPFNDPRLATFTKRLVFSAWNVVPKVIASLASYETERRMMSAGSRQYTNTPAARKKIKPLLQFKKNKRRIGGLSVLPLIYPSPTLARLGDPLEIAGELGANHVVARNTLRHEVERRISNVLSAITTGRPTEGPKDKRWYWAAPLLLDRENGPTEDWLAQPDLAGKWLGDGDGVDGERERTAFADALDHAYALVRGEARDHEGRILKPLGRVPDDLVAVLSDAAIAAPGIVLLRSLNRSRNPDQLEDPDTRDAAASVAWAFRSLFNGPEATAMIRGLLKSGSYWRRVLRYCLHGNLQAVMDEYVHVLRDWVGFVDSEHSAAAGKIASELRNALTLRTVGYTVRDPYPGPDEPDSYRFRSLFALRFGADGSDDEGGLQRSSAVRAAFNSPFWPFILATTSIGQEGLDFHLYCHAVVHWNLPANPVDLEQREGRVHRYKGHAIRKNLAQKHRKSALSGSGDDPWALAFDEAVRQRAPGDNDLIPYWLYPIKNGATIDRYVPSLPLSREVARLENLKKSLAIYRLVFGQPRQEDLVAFLLGRDMNKEEIAELVDELRIDLKPSTTKIAGRQAWN